MALKNGEYWAKRSTERTTEAERRSVEYLKQVKRTYRETAKSLVEELRAMYATYYRKDKTFDMAALHMIPTDGSLKKFRDAMKAAGLTTQLPANYQGRINRLELLNAQAWLEVKKAGARERMLNTQLYSKTIQESYRKTLYDTLKATRKSSTFADIDTRAVGDILNTKFYGKNYSERIWANTDNLAENLGDIISRAVASGQTQEKTIREVQMMFAVNQYSASRLVRTETNYFQNRGEIEAYKEMGIESYVIVATLDSRTSEICQSMDGKKFAVKDMKPGVNTPPFHPNCRTTIAPYVGEEWEPKERIMRDPETGRNQVIDKINYEEWKQKYLIPAQEKGENEGMVRVIVGKASQNLAKLNLSATQKQAIENYVSGETMYINQELRRGGVESLSDDDFAQYTQLRQATRHELGSEATLYRSVDASAIFGEMNALQYDNLVSYVVYGDKQKLIADDAERLIQYAKNRGKIVEKGFMSTTKSQKLALGFKDFTGSDKPVVLELKVPSNAQGLDIGRHMPALEKRMRQQEVLLTANTEYKIIDISAKDGQVYIKANVVVPQLVTEVKPNGIKDTLSQAQYAEYSKKLSAHKPEQTLYDTYASKIHIADTKYKKTAHYEPIGNVIRFNLEVDAKEKIGDDAYRVLFHESGHSIDAMSNGSFRTEPFSAVYRDGLFPKTIKEEARNYAIKLQNEAKKINPNARIDSGYMAITQEVRKYSPKDTTYVSDIFSGATRNRVRIGACHSTTYWDRGGDSRLATEAFAEMYSASILNENATKLIKKYFPKSYKIYRDMIEEMIKRGTSGNI